MCVCARVSFVGWGEGSFLCLGLIAPGLITVCVCVFVCEFVCVCESLVPWLDCSWTDYCMCM
jgi:hypothetical protein